MKAKICKNKLWLRSESGKEYKQLRKAYKCYGGVIYIPEKQNGDMIIKLDLIRLVRPYMK